MQRLKNKILLSYIHIMSIRNLQSSQGKYDQNLNITSLSLKQNTDRTDLVLSEYFSHKETVQWNVNNLQSNVLNDGVRFLKMGNIVHVWFTAFSISGSGSAAHSKQIQADFNIPADLLPYSPTTSNIGAGRVTVSGGKEGFVCKVINGGNKFSFERMDDSDWPISPTINFVKMFFSYVTSWD